MMDVIIRPMEEKDIPSVQKIAKMSWADAYEGLIPPSIQDRFLKEAYSTEMLKKRLRETNLFIAVTGEEKVGFINFSPVMNNGFTELGAIYILPTYQGKGIGTLLLNYGLKTLENVRKVFLHVERNNKRAIRFYQKRGFVKVRKVDEFLYDHPLKTYQMHLNVRE